MLLPILLAWNAYASNLTVCGVDDGGPGDLDGAVNGSIQLNCSSTQGAFVGTATESVDTLNYMLSFHGVFQGAASFTFSAQYTLFGEGDIYPFIQGGKLDGPPGAVSQPGDFLQIANIIVYPVFSGQPLPIGTTNGAGGVGPLQTFNGTATYSSGVSFSAGGADRYFDNPLAVLISTDPNHPIPEPSTLGLTLMAVLPLLAVARKRG